MASAAQASATAFESSPFAANTSASSRRRGSGEQRALAGDEVPLGRFERVDRGDTITGRGVDTTGRERSAPSTGLSASAAIAASWSAASRAASRSPCDSSASTSNDNRSRRATHRRRVCRAHAAGPPPPLRAHRGRGGATPAGRTRRAVLVRFEQTRRPRRAGPVRRAAARVSQPCRPGARSSAIPSGRALRHGRLGLGPPPALQSTEPYAARQCVCSTRGRPSNRSSTVACTSASTLPARRTSPTRSARRQHRAEALADDAEVVHLARRDRRERRVETAEALVQAAGVTRPSPRSASCPHLRLATSPNSATMAISPFRAAQETVDVGPVAGDEHELEIPPLDAGPDRLE